MNFKLLRTVLIVLTISIAVAFLIVGLLKWVEGGTMLAWIVADSCLVLWIWIGLRSKNQPAEG